MKPRFRRLYVKIFLWFCLTAVGTTVLVVAAAGIIGTQPFGKRWMAVTQDLYADTAADIYTQSGPSALAQYLQRIDESTGIEGHLLLAGQTQTGVLGEPVPTTLLPVLEESASKHASVARIARVWTAASPVRSFNGQSYVFAMQVHPFKRFLDGTFFTAFAPRVLLAVVLIAIFCFVLARHITQPVRVLEAAATRLAAGDLSVRARPALRDRNDELAAMAAAFDRMAERIETLLHTQQQMLADISHELRSPLTRIGVSLELLRRGEADVLPAMQDDLDRLNEMIGQVLQLARFDLQPPPLSTAPVALAPLLETICDDANREGLPEQKQVVLEADPTLTITGDAAMLHSAIENIVRNALQYSPPNHAICVRATQQGSSARIEVQDAGPGVPDSALNELFAPFFRLPNSRASHPHGSGLGLSIAARIVNHHGGSIVAANAAPNGLLVTIDLPLAE